MNKGTLTIVRDNSLVLGAPLMECLYSPQQLQRYEVQALEWLKNGGALTLPFPVEVIDLRTPPNRVMDIESITSSWGSATAEAVGNALSNLHSGKKS